MNIQELINKLQDIEWNPGQRVTHFDFTVFWELMFPEDEERRQNENGGIW